MAKQDLVVKLMLDSGAFGNDIREAERKAKNFSDNIKGAGKTAGEFGKELGISAGALGKLGGVLGGAAGVIAAVGAFKDVMKSTHETAKILDGTISGFEGVLKNFQVSIATFDFTNFYEGLDEIYKRAKKAQEALLDFNKSLTGYNFTKSLNLQTLKELEVKYGNASSDSERKAIKSEADAVMRDMRKDLANLATTAEDAFKFNLFSKDGKIKADVDINKLRTWTLEALRTSPEDRKTEQEIYNRIADRIADLNNALDGAEMVDYINNATQNSWLGQLLNNAVNGSTNYVRDANRIDEIRANPEKYKQELADQINRNQGLFVRNTIYNLPNEELNNLLNLLKTIHDENIAINEKVKEIKGWSAATTTPTKTKTTTTTTPKTTTSNEDAEKGSVNYYLNQIEKTERKMNNTAYNSDRWKELNEDLKKYSEEYNKLLDQMNSGYYNLNSINDMTYLMELVSSKRSNMEVGSEEWKAAGIEISGYKNRLEELLRIQEKFDEKYKAPIPLSEIEEMNMALSSTAQIFGSLGEAMQESGVKGLKILGGLSDMTSSLVSGYMEFIAIQEACAAATGVRKASEMPFPFNLAAIATVMGTITTVFSSIKSLVSGKFAEGGIVGGTSYSGDRLFAMVNSGEMILNKRQQNNLSNMLGGGGQVEFHISGDSLVGVLNNGRNKRHLIS